MIESFKDLSIGKYMEIVKWGKDTALDEFTFQVKVLALLADKSEEDILNLPLGEYSAMARKAAFLQSKDFPVARVAEKYVIGGFELVPTRDLRKVTAAQYIDFQEYAKGDTETFMVEILSCFLVPKGKKYNNDYDIVEVQRAIADNMSVEEVLSLVGFFIKLYLRLIRISLSYSRRAAKMIKDREQRKKKLAEIKVQMDLLNDGDGLAMWMQ